MEFKRTAGEWVFDILNHLIMIVLVIITLYPCYYVLVASVSDPARIYEGGGMLLYPKGFSVEAYKN